MKNINWWLGALILSAPLYASAASPRMTVGYYNDLVYVMSTKVDGAGQCADTTGTYFTRSAFYPGPNKSGAKEWRGILASGVLYNEIETLPVTPAAGVAAWSGTYTFAFLPGGPTGSATFSETGTITDNFSSNGTVTSTYAVSGGGTCTEVTLESLTYTGK